MEVAALIQRERRLLKPASATATVVNNSLDAQSTQFPQLGPDNPNNIHNREGHSMDAEQEFQATVTENVVALPIDSSTSINTSNNPNNNIDKDQTMDEPQLQLSPATSSLILQGPAYVGTRARTHPSSSAIKGDSVVHNEVPTLTEEVGTTRSKVAHGSTIPPRSQTNWAKVREKERAIRAKKRMQLKTLLSVCTRVHWMVQC